VPGAAYAIEYAPMPMPKDGLRVRFEPLTA
jgi:hypothetical protein